MFIHSVCVLGLSRETEPTCYTHTHTHTQGGGKVGRLTGMSMQNAGFILVLFVNYCIIFHANNSEPAFAQCCVCACVRTHNIWPLSLKRDRSIDLFYRIG